MELCGKPTPDGPCSWHEGHEKQGIPCKRNGQAHGPKIGGTPKPRLVKRPVPKDTDD